MKKIPLSTDKELGHLPHMQAYICIYVDLNIYQWGKSRYLEQRIWVPTLIEKLDLTSKHIILLLISPSDHLPQKWKGQGSNPGWVSTF